MDAVELLTRMVEIKSVSENEREVAEYLVAYMKEHGLEAHIDAAGNAVGIKSGEITAQEQVEDLVLLGHMDTVPGDIRVRQEGDLLYGRGSVDAKGPLATFIAATIQAQIAENRRVIIVGAVEEEISTSKGAHYAKDQYSPVACIIGEPSNWDAITLGYKGQFLVKYRLEQEVGHTAGENSAVGEKAVIWWQKIQDHCNAFNENHSKLFDQLLPTLRHIQTSSDGLTEVAEAIVGIRLPLHIDIPQLKESVQSFDEHAEVDCYSHEEAYKSDKNNGLVRAFLKSIRLQNARPRFKTKTGTSDMNSVGPKWQCPIVAYGPGDSALDHTPNEHISISEYLRAIAVLKNVLEDSGTLKQKTSK